MGMCEKKMGLESRGVRSLSVQPATLKMQMITTAHVKFLSEGFGCNDENIQGVSVDIN